MIYKKEISLRNYKTVHDQIVKKLRKKIDSYKELLNFENADIYHEINEPELGTLNPDDIVKSYDYHDICEIHSYKKSEAKFGIRIPVENEDDKFLYFDTLEEAENKNCKFSEERTLIKNKNMMQVPFEVPVIVGGGLAMLKYDGFWYTGVEYPQYTRKLMWTPKWWMRLDYKNE